MAKFDPDDALIRRLAALLEETGLSEIEYEAEGRRILEDSGYPIITAETLAEAAEHVVAAWQAATEASQ